MQAPADGPVDYLQNSMGCRSTTGLLVRWAASTRTAVGKPGSLAGKRPHIHIFGMSENMRAAKTSSKSAASFEKSTFFSWLKPPEPNTRSSNCCQKLF